MFVTYFHIGKLCCLPKVNLEQNTLEIQINMIENLTKAAWDEGIENLDSVRRENKNLAEEIKVNNFSANKVTNSIK